MTQAGWVTRADNYLNRVTKSRIIAAVREAKGDTTAELLTDLKKKEMAVEAERLLDGTGWLPEPLRAPAALDEAPAEPLPAFLEGSGSSGRRVSLHLPQPQRSAPHRAGRFSFGSCHDRLRKPASHSSRLGKWPRPTHHCQTQSRHLRRLSPNPHRRGAGRVRHRRRRRRASGSSLLLHRRERTTRRLPRDHARRASRFRP